jgi:hypothetical protein
MSADGSLVLSVGTSEQHRAQPEATDLERREAAVDVRLLRLNSPEIARSATAVKASLTARRCGAAWTAAAPRAHDQIERRRSKKTRENFSNRA